MDDQKNSRTVFYSWQSDLPGKTNRYFIRDALEDACGQVEEQIEEAVRPDSDTRGTPGIRDIHQVILDKLARAEAAVFDVTPVAQTGGGKKVPNPNVMLELGYALLTPGAEHLILLLNAAHAEPVELPFDIRNRPVITFTMRESEAPGVPRKDLARKLADALKTILGQTRPPELTQHERVIAAFRSAAPDRLLQLREYFGDFASEVRRLRPEVCPDWDNQVLASYQAAAGLTIDFARVLASAVEIGPTDEVLAKLVAFLESLLVHCHPTKAEMQARSVFDHAFDFERLMLREIFLVAVDCLIQLGNWEQLNRLFATAFHVETGFKTQAGTFGVLNLHVRAVELWAQRIGTERKERFYSPLGELLHRRFTAAPLSTVLPFQRLRAAELLTFYRSIADSERGSRGVWRPACFPYTEDGGVTILNRARTTAGARALATVLGFDTAVGVDALRDFWAKYRTEPLKYFEHEGFWIRFDEDDWLKATEIGAGAGLIARNG